MAQLTHPEELCERCWSSDPLTAIRRDDDSLPNVTILETIFFDIIFAGLPRIPESGEGLRSTGLGSCPGGIVNLATVPARLGLYTGLVAGFDGDVYTDWIWETLLKQEHVNLTISPRYGDFHISLTVAVTAEGDCVTVAHGHELPESLSSHILTAPTSHTTVVDFGSETDWQNELRSRGAVLFANISFNTSDRWDPTNLQPLRHCRAFTLDTMEAMAYTRADSPSLAACKLTERVPLAVVTDGIGGVYVIDQDTGKEE